MTHVTSEWICLESYLELLSKKQFFGASAYHKAEWLMATSSSFNCEVRCVQTSQNGEVLAITPFMYKRKGPIKLIGASLRGTYTEFSGPLFVPNLGAAIVEKVLKSQHQIVSRHQDYVEWRVKANSNNIDVFSDTLKDLGYEFEYVPSLLVDLSQGEESLWMSFVGRARTAVRKAEKTGLVASVVTPSQEWLLNYYGILTDTFARQGSVVPHPLEFFQAIGELHKSGFIYCVEVRIENGIGAAAIFVKDNSRMMYLSGVATKEGMRLAASSLVQWEAMKLGISHGVIDYDMGGLGVVSIDKFKRSFGGIEINHLKWTRRTGLFRFIEPLAVWLAKRDRISLS
jgi:hypothetical protein